MSDWFSNVFGESEGSYAECKAKLESKKEANRVFLRAKGKEEWFCAGRFECPTLQDLRERGADVLMPGKLVVKNVLGDVAEKHAELESRNATFQVASQFNCLEFTSPTRVPEDGITGYVSDRTQGPACSIACGPATAYRNYFASVKDGPEEGGQTREHMLDNLADMGALLGNDEWQLWRMQGGYSMADDSQLEKLNQKLTEFGPGRMDEVRRTLRIGLHEDVQVTATRWGASRVDGSEQLVTQVFGSACAVAYNRSRAENWEQFATVILEASYEATLWAAVLATQRHRNLGSELHGANIVYLTALGGGVFGNSMDWIETAMRHAFNTFKDYDLDIRIVTYSGAIPTQLRRLEQASVDGDFSKTIPMCSPCDADGSADASKAAAAKAKAAPAVHTREAAMKARAEASDSSDSDTPIIKRCLSWRDYRTCRTSDFGVCPFKHDD